MFLGFQFIRRSSYLSPIVFMMIVFSLSVNALTFSQAEEGVDYDSVVYLKTYGPDQSGDPDTPGYCNGAILSDRIIVTAAHCVAASQVVKNFKVYVEFGRYYYVKKPSGESVRIGYKKIYSVEENAQFVFVPGFLAKLSKGGINTKISPDEDMAIIQMTNPLPITQYNVVPAQLLPEQKITPILSKIAQSSPHVVSINPIAQMSTSDYKRKANLNKISMATQLSLKSTSQSRVEPMDSGSPVFIIDNQQKYVVAVVKGRAETLFANWDVFAVIGSRICQMAQTLSMSESELSVFCKKN